MVATIEMAGARLNSADWVTVPRMMAVDSPSFLPCFQARMREKQRLGQHKDHNKAAQSIHKSAFFKIHITFPLYSAVINRI